MITQVHSVSVWEHRAEPPGVELTAVARYPSPLGLPKAIRSYLRGRAKESFAVVRYVLVGNCGTRAAELSALHVQMLSEAGVELEFATALPEPIATAADPVSSTIFSAYCRTNAGHIDDALHVLAPPRLRPALLDLGMLMVDDTDRGDLWFSSSSVAGRNGSKNELWDVIGEIASSDWKNAIEAAVSLRIEASDGGSILLSREILRRLTTMRSRLTITCTYSGGREPE